MLPPREKGSNPEAHTCCACYTHNGLSCCNDGHPTEKAMHAGYLQREFGS